MTWTYTDPSRLVVISDDGCQSMLTSALPEGTEIAEPAPPSTAELREAYKAAVRDFLDAGAQAEDYDSIITATSYAGSSIQRWREDSARFLAWRDAVIVAAYLVEQAIAGGASPPSIADFIAGLPPLPKAAP